MPVPRNNCRGPHRIWPRGLAEKFAFPKFGDLAESGDTFLGMAVKRGEDASGGGDRWLQFDMRPWPHTALTARKCARGFGTKVGRSGAGRQELPDGPGRVAGVRERAAGRGLAGEERRGGRCRNVVVGL